MQILQNEKGQRFVAEFPPELARPTQYGASVKTSAVYLSMFQLIPYERVQTQFAGQYGMALGLLDFGCTKNISPEFCQACGTGVERLT